MVLVQVVLRKKKYSKKWALGVSSSKSCATANAVNNGTEYLYFLAELRSLCLALCDDVLRASARLCFIN